jgi:choline-sulfatase
MEPPKNPQAELPVDFKNLATVMKAAGYNVVYKGKWHCSKSATPGEAVPADLEKYGFSRWNPPDAGADQSVPEAGGGFVDNDGRFIDSTGEGAAEGALQYLSSNAAQEQPFFMVISVVNPHDVLFYPSKTFEEAGYDDSWLEGSIREPATWDEDLSTKPSVQAEFLRIFNLTGKPENAEQRRNYLNFYGNLMRSSDSYLVNVLDKLEETGLFDNTLVVRTADHGEMGLAHGGLRQKNFNFYEEATRVPLVYSNPKLFPAPAQTDALVSHVDFLPTLASLAGAPKPARAKWEGVDYSSLVLRPKRAKPVQDYVVFTYDDFQSGQKNGPYPKPP